MRVMAVPTEFTAQALVVAVEAVNFQRTIYRIHAGMPLCWRLIARGTSLVAGQANPVHAIRPTDIDQAEGRDR